MCPKEVRMRKLLLMLTVTSLGVTAASTAQQAPVELKEGDPAPNFSLPGSDGKTHRLSDYKGKGLALAWFPAAFTGG